MKRESSIPLLALAYLSLASLGLQDGLLGVAWPSVRHTFNVSLDSMGIILAAGTLGYFVSSFNSGRIINRFGISTLLIGSSVLKMIGTGSFALASGWWGVIFAAMLGGLGGGGIDAGFNTYVATHHSAGRMNWLHASFGVGVTLGPLLMTSILAAGQVWRWGYAVAGIVQALLTLTLIFGLAAWPIRSTPGEAPAEAASVKSRATLRIPAVWLGIAVFFIYTGLEIAAGQWSYSLLTEGRGVIASSAGLWVSIYWGSFTVGRFLSGFLADRIEATLFLRAAMLGAGIGAALFWWNPVQEVGFAGLALLGFSLAPVFPMLIAMTPRRLGSEHAAHAIGFQIGAASLGAAAIPGLAGVLAERINLEVIGPLLALAAVLMFALHEALVAATRRKTGATQPGPEQA